MTLGHPHPHQATDRSLTPAQFEVFEKEFVSRPANRLMQNAVTQTPVDDIALDRRIVTAVDHSVSHHLDDWKVTNQKKSGRCWMFAGLNLLRVGAAQKLGVKDFEFSQNYLLWWDKFERANHFLEAIIETSDRDVDDRTVAHLLGDPISDGGQWNMFVALVAKHGLVPKSAMPETDSSSATGPMNRALKSLLRRGPGICAERSPRGPRRSACTSERCWPPSTAYSASTSVHRRSGFFGSGGTRTRSSTARAG